MLNTIFGVGFALSIGVFGILIVCSLIYLAYIMYRWMRQL